MSHKHLSLQVNVYKYLSTSKRPCKQMTPRNQHKQMSCQQITPLRCTTNTEERPGCITNQILKLVRTWTSKKCPLMWRKKWHLFRSEKKWHLWRPFPTTFNFLRGSKISGQKGEGASWPIIFLAQNPIQSISSKLNFPFFRGEGSKISGDWGGLWLAKFF